MTFSPDVDLRLHLEQLAHPRVPHHYSRPETGHGDPMTSGAAGQVSWAPLAERTSRMAFLLASQGVACWESCSMEDPRQGPPLPPTRLKQTRQPAAPNTGANTRRR